MDRSTRWLRLALIGFAIGQAWTCRFYSNPDGTAYRDIARAYLRGDWADALSTYWSPLYSWLLAGFFAVFGQQAERALPLTHAVNLCGFLLALWGWEFLMAEWERWQGPPAHRTLVQVAGYCTFFWSCIHLMNVGLDTPDLFVVAIFLSLSALLVRVRRGAARGVDYIAIGALIGAGFLTKAACLVLLPAVLVVLAAIFRSARDRRIWIACAAACLTMAPFVTVLSASRHRFVLTDTGKLNYTMLVGGFSVEGYKESLTPLPGDLPHPFVDRSNMVRVLSFEKHVTGTYPIHNDPSWWLEGLPIKTNRALACWSIASGTLLSLWLFTGCPSLVLPILGLAAGARGVWAALKRLWFLAIPSLAVLAGYVAIILHARYIAGCFAVFGFVPIAGMWGVSLSRGQRRLFMPLLMATMLFNMWYDLVSVPFFLVGELLHASDPRKKSGLAIADSLRDNGVRPPHETSVLRA
jgi:4-amino-4-deoxy-L-arabinose transferase-like glycosyltransferase